MALDYAFSALVSFIKMIDRPIHGNDIQICTRKQTGTKMNKQQELNDCLAESLYLGDYDDARDYLKKGANPNHDTGNGISPFLFLCMSNDHPDLLRTMIDHGADIGQRDHKNRDGLHLAKTAGHDGNAYILMAMGIEAALRIHENKTLKNTPQPESSKICDIDADGQDELTPQQSATSTNNGVLLYDLKAWKFQRRNIRPVHTPNVRRRAI